MPASPLVVIHDASTRRWLRLTHPLEVVEVREHAAILPALAAIETAVEDRGLLAAGFLSYEAAPAFDEALVTHAPPPGFPLLWFGLFAEAETAAALPAAKDLSSAALAWAPSVDESEYHRAIATIKACIARGETYQVNYTLRLSAAFPGDPWQLFLALQAAQRADYAAYVDTGRFAICSASPELFFTRAGEALTARPMKGTAPRACTSAEDAEQGHWLQASEKNRAENVMIVDMIRNDLGRIAVPGSVEVPHLFTVERYPTVWQMTSTVTARSSRPTREVVQSLFPCASVTGAPKAQTMKIIAGLETTPRRLYTGTIGFLASGQRAQFNVAIRTVVVDREDVSAEYGVGGGIVWDSDAADEYAECGHKARVLSAQVPAFDLLESLLWTPGDDYLLLTEHLDRIMASAAYFDFAAERDPICHALRAASRGLPPHPHKVRLLCARDGSLKVETARLERLALEAPVRLRLAAAPVDRTDVFLYHKTTRRTVYEQARAGRPDCDDVVLYNDLGEATETLIANLVVVQADERLTPPVRCGLLAGTFRGHLLAQGASREAVIPLGLLRLAREIFVINSVRQWRRAVLLPATDGQA